MPRNGSGIYSLPAGNPVVPQTIIDAGWANPTMNDLGAALTGSLPRDGQAPMTGPFRAADGTGTNPSITFNSDGGTGFFRPTTNTLAITVGSDEKLRIVGGNLLVGTTTNNGEKLNVNGTTRLQGKLLVTTGGIEATGNVAVTGDTTLTGGLAVTGTSALAATTVSTTLGVTGAVTLSSTLGVTGTSTLGTVNANTVVASGAITAASFIGAGTGLTGTAASLTAGNATLAAQATRNQANTQFVCGDIAATSTASNSVSSLNIRNNGGIGDNNVAAISFECTGQYGVKMHLRPDGYFGLGGWWSPAWRWYSDPSGNMTASGDVIAYSDPRLKRKVKRIPNALEKLETLDGVNFTWKKKKGLGKAGKADVGVLSDQVKAVMPEAVHTSGIEVAGTKYDMVAYDKLIPLLIEAVKDLSAQVKELRGD